LRAKTQTKKRSASEVARAEARATPRLRIRMGDGLILGPGKIDLLAAIAREGSISAAAREMKMSYRRAWLLVDEMNRMFDGPLVMAAPGGTRGGGAEVTPLGETVAAAYRRIVKRTEQAIHEELGRIDKDKSG
jgi:molybdate transport system regulatory protein